MLTYSSKHLGLVLLCAVSLSACSNVGRSTARMSTAAHAESVRFDAKMRDLFDSENGEDVRVPKVPEIYCYGTLGESECYGYRLAGEDHRLVGKQIPPQQFAHDSYPSPEYKPPVPVVIVAETIPAAGIPTPPLYGGVPLAHGEVLYEVPESAIQANEEIPEYRKPRELLPTIQVKEY